MKYEAKMNGKVEDMDGGGKDGGGNDATAER
jgi:hypothetical protein